MNGYRNRMIKKTTALGVETFKGQTLEDKIDQIMNNGEPIDETAPLVYTDKEDGVNPSHNIRSDRFEFAVEALDWNEKQRLAKRESMKKIETDEADNGDGKAEPKDATN